MKIYKYRDFSSPSEDDFARLEDSVHRLLVWCARPDTLNDPQEFVWQCDYTPTPATPALLAGVLVKARGRTSTDAQGIAAAAIQNGRLEVIVKPVFDGMIEQCRNEIGLACFGATPDNPTLWRRYGGDGAGVCIEFDVPADLLGTQLHRVEYPKEKRLHVDQLLRAFVDRNEAQVVYDVALLSKPSSWADEEEIRFVSQRHSILVAIDRAQVPCVYLGDSLGADVRARIERITVQVRLAERGR
jgi:hypothetical protein